MFQTLILSDITDYVVKDKFLLVTVKAKYPAMVDKLIKFKFSSKEESGSAIEKLHNMVEGKVQYRDI